MNDLRSIVLLGAAVLAALLSGCGPDYGGRQEVKGTVKLKGQPLDQGVIDFTPVESQPTKGGAVISKGSYSIPRSSGLMKGKYRVMITSGDGRTREDSNEPPGPSGANIISKERIPADYNVNTKQEIEVTDKGTNVFDFDIP
jgi:hypothetical protein